MHLEVQVGVGLMDQPQYGGQQIRGDGRDDAEPQHTRERRAGRLRLLQQIADGLQDRPGPGRQPLPRGRQQHLARRTLQQLHSEGLLQRGDRPGQRGLAHPDLGRRLAEMQMLGHRRERPQLGQAGLAGSAALTRR